MIRLITTTNAAIASETTQKRARKYLRSKNNWTSTTENHAPTRRVIARHQGPARHELAVSSYVCLDQQRAAARSYPANKQGEHAQRNQHVSKHAYIDACLRAKGWKLVSRMC
eukprot:4801223-Pleurochrysis_carterae.AAC.2